MVSSPHPSSQKFGDTFFQKKSFPWGQEGEKFMKTGANLKAIQWYVDGDVES